MNSVFPPIFYTLRFDNRAQAETVCRNLGYWQEGDEADGIPAGPISAGIIRGEDGSRRGFQIIEIGQDPIVTPATHDQAGNEITPAVRLQGYYVNIAGLLPTEAELFQVPYGSAGSRFYELG